MKSRPFLRRLVSNWPAKVLSVVAALLLVVFNNISRLEERYISVPLELRLPNDLVAASSYPSRVRVTLRGESEGVQRILDEDVDAHLDLRNVETEGVVTASVRVNRIGTALGVDPLEVYVEPAEVTLAVEQKAQKSLEVEPTLSGFVPVGYQLTGYQISPSSVEVEGPESEAAPLEVVRTEEIELGGRRNDFSVRVRLVRPSPGITFLGGDVVEFRGIVEEAVILNTFEPVETVVINLAPGLTISSALPTGSIRVQGNQLDLDNVTVDQVQIVADASRVTTPGRYALRTRPEVPSGLAVLRYEPQTVDVQVVRSGE
ncbi:MAG: YbbR-like domain-containing protein [Spirochaetaceae bacterium]